MYLMGLKLGFTTEDLRTMKYPYLTMFIQEYAWQNDTDEDDVHDATSSDIAKLNSML